MKVRENDWGYKRKRKKRDSDPVREKRGRWRETRRGFSRSNLQQCFRQFGPLLSLYFYKASRNTSSAIHFISIPTPASHLHSVSFTSPFHFSACHYISWMITYWQFLHWHSTGQDTTLPASKAGKKMVNLFFFQSCLSFSFLVPPPWVPVLFSGFHRPPSPPQNSWSNPDLCHLTLMSPYRASDSPGTWGQIACLVSPQQQMNQALNSSPDWLWWHDSWWAEHHRATSLSYTGITGALNRGRKAAVQIQAGFIKSNLSFFKTQLEWNIDPILPQEWMWKWKQL